MSVVTGQNLNFAIPAEYVVRLQNSKAELRPFRAISETEARKGLFGRIGGEPPRSGVVGENFQWFGGHGDFSFSLHNRLAEDVSKVRGFAVFYNPEGEPLDSWPINYDATIPARGAKRINGEVGDDIRYFYYWWDKHARVWRKVANITDIPDDAWKRKGVEHREGKVEFRILDFSVGAD